MPEAGPDRDKLGETSDDLPAVDGHQHFWNPSRLALPWMTEALARIDRAFEPGDLEPQMRAARVDATILVQSACLDADTDLMFEHARRHPWIAAVVAWVALDDPPRAAGRLDELAKEPALRGIRHLIHEEQDPHWILKPTVLDGLRLLEDRGLILELPAVFPRHLGDVPTLARLFPRLTIVIDHLGKPPLGKPAMAHWGRLLRDAAAHPNVAAKLSGLNTATARADWSADDLRPAVEAALGAFGPDRPAVRQRLAGRAAQRRLRPRVGADAPSDPRGRARPCRGAARGHGPPHLPAGIAHWRPAPGTLSDRGN